VGTDDEYDDFVRSFGNVARHLTKDCLEVAKAIAASKLYVGNQSSAFWIAAGLRVPLLQEVYEHAPNSIIRYQGAVYCFDGNVDFESLPQ
jgi:ADP-heptose:LPS heptosyltransferase